MAKPHGHSLCDRTLQMRRIAIIGAGNWGTALAIIAGRAGHEVCLWARDPGIVEGINRNRYNPAHLKGAEITNRVRATEDLDQAASGAELIVLATPSHALRLVLTRLAPSVPPGAIIVSATKGIELERGQRMSQVVRELLGERFLTQFVCLSGPSFAKEVVEGHPTAIVAASAEADAALQVQTALSFENLRVYTNDDVVGAELGGAVKNVMAIAAGMVVGLGFGSNSVAALITRGLAEMSRLALREGASTETMMGLAGVGDLVLTCTGGLSRNRFVGVELGKGRGLEEITQGMNEVAEGVNTTRAVKRLASSVAIEMPITDQVHAVLYEGKGAREATIDLMTRPLREEF